jgi:hypothetical protein
MKIFTADEMRAKPVLITTKGEIFIGGEQILAEYPIAQDGITVERLRGSLNKLTLTLLVGPVTIDTKSPGVSPETDD